MNDIVQRVALGLYSEFVRERDPERALWRFKRLPDATREQWEAEAKIAVRICEAHFVGELTP